ncbi:MAG TPA: efflux transporter outer membrane subunit [Chitinophaga sp.]
MRRSIPLYTSLLLLMVGLWACRAGRNYVQPALPLPARFQTATADTLSVGDMQWKQFFTDTALVSLIDTGLQHNYDLQLAITRIDAAGEQVKQARAAFIPTVDASVGAQTNYLSKNSLNGLSTTSFLKKNHIEDYSVQVNVSWEADVWGKLRRQKEAALAGYLQTYEAKKAVQTRLVADIAAAYYNLLMLDEQLAIARHNVQLGDSILAIIQLQKTAGDATQLAVEQAYVQRQAAAVLIPQLQRSIALQENGLHILTGTLPGPVATRGDLRAIAPADHLSAGIPANLVSRRPDVRANELSLVAANASVGAAQANMYPVLSITAGGGLDAFKASNWFNIPNSLFGLVGGTIAQPLLQRRQLKTQYEVAKINREQAVITFKQSVLNAVGEVSNALVSIDRLGEQEVITSNRMDTLQLAIFNASLLYKAGLANYLEVITAQSNLLQSQLDFADIRRQRLSANVELYRALGGGWK